MTTQTKTITEFLLARIAEDEQWARVNAAGKRPAGGWTTYVMAECEAKRRIVEMIAGDDGGWCSPDRVGLGEMVLEHLASVYADHPDYRPEWSADAED